MTESFRRTLRSFLRGEKPQTRSEAMTLVSEWFSRYDPDPGIVAEEVDRYLRMPPRRPAGVGGWLSGLGRG